MKPSDLILDTLTTRAQQAGALDVLTGEKDQFVALRWLSDFTRLDFDAIVDAFAELERKRVVRTDATPDGFGIRVWFLEAA